MHRAIRWGSFVLAAVLFENGLLGIPSTVGAQIHWLGGGGRHLVTPVLAVMFALVLGLVALGPEKVQRWVEAIHGTQGGSVKAGHSIRAGGDITATADINAGGYIHSGRNIHSGEPRQTAPIKSSSARIPADQSMPRPPKADLASRLAQLYHEAEPLKVKLKIGRIGVAAGVLNGTSKQAQIELEQQVHAWDMQVLLALPKQANLKWLTASTLPIPHPTRSLIEPETDITGLDTFLKTKIACLKEIISDM